MAWRLLVSSAAKVRETAEVRETKGAFLEHRETTGRISEGSAEAMSLRSASPAGTAVNSAAAGFTAVLVSALSVWFRLSRPLPLQLTAVLSVFQFQPCHPCSYMMAKKKKKRTKEKASHAAQAG